MAVGADGSVAPEALQMIPVGRNAHSIRVDATNRFAYVPTLGSDAVFLFTFDAKAGKLASNTPALQLTSPGAGPRHFVISADNRFLYLLCEMTAEIVTFAIDAGTGLLTTTSSVSGLAPDSALVPGAPRGGTPTRNLDRDIWAADIHLTPDGKVLYVSERTGSTLNAFGVDGATGKLTYRSTHATERQPRGFAIDPSGRFLVATGEKSDTISLYGIDAASGALERRRRYPTGKGANWVEFVSFDAGQR
jgi:6-phosphogluconolactonase